MLEIVQNERGKYQQMLADWKAEQEDLRKEIQQRDSIIDRLRLESQEISTIMKEQIEDIITESQK